MLQLTNSRNRDYIPVYRILPPGIDEAGYKLYKESGDGYARIINN